MYNLSTTKLPLLATGFLTLCFVESLLHYTVQDHKYAPMASIFGWLSLGTDWLCIHDLQWGSSVVFTFDGAFSGPFIFLKFNIKNKIRNISHKFLAKRLKKT